MTARDARAGAERRADFARARLLVLRGRTGDARKLLASHGAAPAVIEIVPDRDGKGVVR